MVLSPASYFIVVRINNALFCIETLDPSQFRCVWSILLPFIGTGGLASEFLMIRHYIEGSALILLSFFMFVMALRRSSFKLACAAAVPYFLAMSAKEIYVPMAIIVLFVPEKKWLFRFKYAYSPFGDSAHLFCLGDHGCWEERWEAIRIHSSAADIFSEVLSNCGKKSYRISKNAFGVAFFWFALASCCPCACRHFSIRIHFLLCAKQKIVHTVILCRVISVRICPARSHLHHFFSGRICYRIV